MSAGEVPVEIYATGACPYCVRARRLLQSKGVSYTEVRVDLDRERRSEMVNRSAGASTVPQIFIRGSHVGGYDELAALDRAGRLDALLNPTDT